MRNLLSTPVLREGRVVALAVAANKAADYSAEDASEVEAFVSSVEIILEKRRAEEALRNSERFARATIDALSANIAVLDEDGVIINVNKAWRDFAESN